MFLLFLMLREHQRISNQQFQSDQNCKFSQSPRNMVGDRSANFLLQNLQVHTKQNVIHGLQGAVYVYYTDAMFRSPRRPFLLKSTSEQWTRDQKNIFASCFVINESIIMSIICLVICLIKCYWTLLDSFCFLSAI